VFGFAGHGCSNYDVGAMNWRMLVFRVIVGTALAGLVALFIVGQFGTDPADCEWGVDIGCF
jgi:hypothetical protein